MWYPPRPPRGTSWAHAPRLPHREDAPGGLVGRRRALGPCSSGVLRPAPGPGHHVSAQPSRPLELLSPAPTCPPLAAPRGRARFRQRCVRVPGAASQLLRVLFCVLGARGSPGLSRLRPVPPRCAARFCRTPRPAPRPHAAVPAIPARPLP